jgi:probable rRNA maturation factor
MSDLVVETHVEDGLDLPVGEERLAAVLERVLSAEGVEAGRLSVALVGDESIAALHRDYLGHDGPTDVISFALHGPGQPLVGDVYVGAEQAARQAAEWGVPLEVELLRLAIHGTLHVLGYDHPEGEDREQSPMYHRQEQLIAELLG